MDLFEPIVAEDKFHPSFRRMMNTSAYDAAKPLINDWAKGLGGKKESLKFTKEFQTSFNSTFWEVYLNRAFSDLGFKIDYTFDSPDFHLIHPNGAVINVEAVTANNRDHLKEIYHRPEKLKEKIQSKRVDALDESTIKLIGKIKDKNQLFIGDGKKKHPYSSLDHVKGKPFVLAIAPFEQHLAHHQNNMAINRVLFGVEPPDPETMEYRKIESILTKNGSEIDLGIFTNDSYKHISAVIFSSTATISKALVQSGFEGFVRATRYREMSIPDFINNEGKEALGVTHIQISENHDLFRRRLPNEDGVFGSDECLCDASLYHETHLDGLHIFYNPFAEYPLEKSLLNAPEITHNYYDKEYRLPFVEHPDGALVSRMTVIGVSKTDV